ncbi:aspartate/glutamate racemase family protein [Brachybacterium timonense]|uniref:aspartate/glutamate racemase family protein n=1 Tax=Brachybacterium timonense TaxID=2050896 RepID=UPI001FEA40B7|nr:amino acid racemase [Brachybacterium timonense]
MSEQLSASWTQPVVGVLGGLGPAATAVFIDLLVRATRAETDQDHIDAIITQHSSTPDRTAAILDPHAPDPGVVLAADARLLQRMGVRVLVMPCNTAHHYVREVENVLDENVRFVSILDETVQAAARMVKPTGRPVAVFATEGNMHAGVYRDALAEEGLDTWAPPRALQNRINTLIYDQVKAGAPVDRGQFEQCIAEAIDAGAGVVVLGCTELSVIHDQHGFRGDTRIVDSLTELALATVRAAGKELSPAFSG